MSLKRKTARWVEANIISDDQRAQIMFHKKQRSSGKFNKGIFGFGAFTIIIGLLSIIAANWHAIPAHLKLSIHLVLNTALAFGVFHFNKKDAKLPKELCLLGLFGLTLTLIALIGQVFHLNGTVTSALILWAGLTTPFILLYGRSRISLTPWAILATITPTLMFGQYLVPHLSDELQILTTNALAIFTPIALVAAALNLKNTEQSPLPQILTNTGAVFTTLLTNGAIFLWYGKGIRGILYEHNLLLPCLALFAIAAALVYGLKYARNYDSKYITWFLWGSLAIAALPYIGGILESEIIAALSFIVYWGFLGYIGQKTAQQWLITTSVTLCCIRVYIAYIEVFGSMLQTGIGMVISGSLLIVAAWSIKKINSALTQKPE